MTLHGLRIFKFLSFSSILGLSAQVAMADSTLIYSGSEYFTASPVEMVIDINIDDTSGGGIVSLDQFYAFDDSGTDGSLGGSLSYGTAGTGSASVSLANETTGPLIQVTAQSEGNYVPADPDEIHISAVSSMDFELQYDDGGAGSSVEATAVICLMPIRLSLTQGGAVANPASATYSYSLEIDGSEIYASSISLTQTPTGALQITNLQGPLRSDGVFFQSGNTKGFDFPALTIEKSMGLFDDGVAYEGHISFSAITEAPDDNWGAFAGPQVGGADQSEFFPKLGAPVPEPQSVVMLLSGLLVFTLRRRR